MVQVKGQGRGANFRIPIQACEKIDSSDSEELQHTVTAPAETHPKDTSNSTFVQSHVQQQAPRRLVSDNHGSMFKPPLIPFVPNGVKRKKSKSNQTSSSKMSSSSSSSKNAHSPVESYMFYYDYDRFN